MRIESYRFGSIRIDGQTYTNDIKIVNNSVKPDWKRKNGHIVLAGDIEDILEAGPEIMVIGKGSPGQMAPDRKLAEELERKGIRMISKPTAEAAEEFNALQKENRKIAAGFHLTC